MLVEKLDYNFNFLDFKNLCLRFIVENRDLFFKPSIGGTLRQLSVQHSSKPILNKVVDGIGATSNYNNYKINDYNIINNFFSNTIVEKIIKDYNLFRTRIMQLNYKECYSVHKDIEKRIHIPIKTNSKSFMVFTEDNEIFHLQEGSVYLVDTTHFHTYLNGGNEERIHFVGSCVQ